MTRVLVPQGLARVSVWLNAPASAPKIVRAGSVNCLAVYVQPFADLRKPFDARRRNQSLRSGADIQRG